MLKETDNYYNSKDEPVRSCLLAIRDIVLSVDEQVTENWKWHMPVFLYRKKMLCYLRLDKSTGEPYLGIVKGDMIEHPLLIRGNRKKMKTLHLVSSEDLPVKLIWEILREAIKLY